MQSEEFCGFRKRFQIPHFFDRGAVGRALLPVLADGAIQLRNFRSFLQLASHVSNGVMAHEKPAE